MKISICGGVIFLFVTGLMSFNALTTSLKKTKTAKTGGVKTRA
ncbi:MAG: hypothetical protein ACKOBC_06885 [Hyphomicrobiales bacterium]